MRQKRAGKVVLHRFRQSIGHSDLRRSGAPHPKIPDGNRVEFLEKLIADRRWTEIDPVEFLRVFENLSEEARRSDGQPRARESLERLVTAAVGREKRADASKPRLPLDVKRSPLPDYAYLAEIGAQLQRYQQGAAALAVLEAIQAAAGGDSTAILEERILAEMTSRREEASRSDAQRRTPPERSFPGTQPRSREVLSEPALRIAAAAAARELMLAYRRLVEQLKTEAGIRRHFGMKERNPK